jgi:hypothetical protein
VSPILQCLLLLSLRLFLSPAAHIPVCQLALPPRLPCACVCVHNFFKLGLEASLEEQGGGPTDRIGWDAKFAPTQLNARHVRAVQTHADSAITFLRHTHAHTGYAMQAGVNTETHACTHTHKVKGGRNSSWAAVGNPPTGRSATRLLGVYSFFPLSFVNLICGLPIWDGAAL